jgi:hypothetical protein
MKVVTPGSTDTKLAVVESCWELNHGLDQRLPAQLKFT